MRDSMGSDEMADDEMQELRDAAPSMQQRRGRGQVVRELTEAKLLRAGIASICGDKSTAMAHLSFAIDRFKECRSKFWHALALRRKGQLLGGAEGAKLVDEAMTGEQIIIAKAGKPMVVLKPYVEHVTQRKGGQLAGQIVEAPGCWDDDELSESLHSPIYPTPPAGSMRLADGPSD